MDDNWNEVRPKNAVMCPICLGAKKRKEYFDPELTGIGEMLVNCTGCNGKGWVILNKPGFKNGISRAPESHYKPFDEEDDDMDY